MRNIKKLVAFIFLFLCTSLSSLFGMERPSKKSKCLQWTRKEIETVFTACRDGKYETVETFLKKGFDPNLKLNFPLTPIHNTRPLHWAAGSGHAHIVDLLVEHKADVNLVDVLSQTPLYKAVGRFHTDAVQKLLDAGAHVNIADFDLHTPLHWMCVNSLLELERDLESELKIIIMLREHGAQNWKLNKRRFSPFHYVAQLNKPERIYSLLMPLKTKDQQRAELKRIKKLLPIIMPAAQCISEKILKKQYLEVHVCRIKELAKHDVSNNIKAIKTCMSEQERARLKMTLEMTIDAPNYSSMTPRDLATDQTVKALFDPKAWQ